MAEFPSCSSSTTSCAKSGCIRRGLAYPCMMWQGRVIWENQWVWPIPIHYRPSSIPRSENGNSAVWKCKFHAKKVKFCAQKRNFCTEKLLWYSQWYSEFCTQKNWNSALKKMEIPCSRMDILISVLSKWTFFPMPWKVPWFFHAKSGSSTHFRAASFKSKFCANSTIAESWRDWPGTDIISHHNKIFWFTSNIHVYICNLSVLIARWGWAVFHRR